ncbi:hypothetical protein [Methylobacter tundripaludum]|uniref:hypothetical protein n=1 Tax=Methylobacter tundripaludum TaxID=173365 RepID=UPI00190F5FD4|nr:hypothetical protein [Methylobacter tundripaludum]
MATVVLLLSDGLYHGLACHLRVVLPCLTLFPGLGRRVYSNGPKIALPGGFLLWGGFFLILILVFFPYPLFWVLWIGTLAIFSGQLLRKGVWNPFTAMAEGNWSPALLVALSSLCNGFLWELWKLGQQRQSGISGNQPQLLDIRHSLRQCHSHLFRNAVIGIHGLHAFRYSGLGGVHLARSIVRI